MKKRKKHRFWMTGIWTYPLWLIGMYFAEIYFIDDFIHPPEGIRKLIIWLIPGIICLFIFMSNIQKILEVDKPNDGRTGEAFSKAKYPNIKDSYLSDKPEGFVLGKINGKYIRKEVSKDGVNACFVGQPGSGKSVLLIGILLSCLYKNKILKNNKKSFNWFLVDIKGELWQKVFKKKAETYRAEDADILQVVQPSNRKSFGWDAFYRIHKPGRVSDTDKLKACQDIADALIQKSGDNPFFEINGKKILTGVFFYYMGKGLDFIPIIQKLQRTPLDQLLKEIVKEAEKENQGIVLDKLKSFVGKEGNEAIQNVEATMRTCLDVFAYPDIEFMFQSNPNRTSPAALNDGVTNIDLAIEESMLKTYEPVFRLVTMQVLKHAEGEFKEEDDRHTAIIIDEAARVGEIQGLADSMATLRSRHTSLFCFFQNLQQFKEIYGKGADAILNLFTLKGFLSGAGDRETTEYVQQLAGKYINEKRSYSKDGAIVNGATKMQYSEDLIQVVEAQDMTELVSKKEIIVLLDGHYYRFKKLFYFEDSILSKIANEIKENNETYKPKQLI